jgi:hypothetical protein
MEWKVALGAADPKKRLAVITVAVFCGLLGFVFTKSLIVGIVGVAVILAGTAEVFLPCKYRLDVKGATSKIGLSEYFIAWDEIKREIEDDGGIRLSPLPEPTRLERFRGVYLRTPGNRDLVLSTIRQFRKINGSDDH